jgi:uncharacterized protein with PQ loop repeat
VTAVIGWLGTFLLASAAIPQTVKVWREGNAKGLSWWYLVLLWLGFLCMDVYSYRRHAGDALLVSYSLQLCLFFLMIVRKAFPRRPLG